ncbi:uncharacterized protein DS421_15g498120 [Arachis hypogaea]|nr:uncharacterized protein DS421_15g498120 [Arachis hypogaea]
MFVVGGSDVANECHAGVSTGWLMWQMKMKEREVLCDQPQGGQVRVEAREYQSGVGVGNILCSDGLERRPTQISPSLDARITTVVEEDGVGSFNR